MVELGLFLALSLRGPPSPLRRYEVEVDRRRARAAQLRQELRAAEAALAEAHRDLRDVQVKWGAAQAVGRRLLAMGIQSPQEKARADEVFRVLTAAAREAGVSPGEVLRSVSLRR